MGESGHRGAIRALVAGAIFAALAGCGPQTIVSNIFPERYSIETTVEFTDGPRRQVQTLVSTCSVMDETDSLTGAYRFKLRGDRHTFIRADGSVLVLGDLNRCRWTEAPGQGSTQEVQPPEGATNAFARDQLPDHDSYLFFKDSGFKRVDVLSTHALFAGLGSPAVAAARLRSVPNAPITRTLEAAFGPSAVKPVHEIASSMVGELQPGRFVGVTARALSPAGAGCKEFKGPGPIALAPNHPCRAPTNVCREATQTDCVRAIGGVRPRIDSGYRRVTLSLDALEPQYRETLYDAELLTAAGAPSVMMGESLRWTPEVCAGRLCFPFDDPLSSAAFYYPERKILLEVTLSSRTLHPGMFRDLIGWT